MSQDADRDVLILRIAALEKAVDGLQRDLAEMRAPSGREPSFPPPPAAVVEAEPAPAPQRTPRIDLETLVGRYGMLALATLLALAAAGTFVGWAISRGLFGPPVRVALGLVAAAALGVWGLRLRRRERSFGDSVLGLSLAVTHVCAWAAGPSLHLVPPFVALALSAVASVALAGFALVEEDQPLWCVGFGGAAVAPFVTSSGEGTAPMLAAYGAAVLIAGGSALASRPWRVAARVFGAAAALFTVALLTLPLHQHSAELAVALPFVALLFGVAPFARGAVLRPRLRTLGLLAMAASFRFVAEPSPAPLAAIVTAAGGGVLWLVLLELFDTEPASTLLDGLGSATPSLPDWIDGGVIPGGFALATALALNRPDAAMMACGIAGTALAVVAFRREGGALRDALAMASFLTANSAVLLATRSAANLATAAVAGNAALFALLHRPVPNRSWKWAPHAALVLAGIGALSLLTLRRSYEYTPFLTRESAAALAVAAAWVLTLRLSGANATRPALCVFAFLWVNQELAWAVSPAVATLLIVTWYASSGVACVGFGRARNEARLRHLGLALGVVAALLAIKAAWALDSAAARIGAYLVVSGFLLGIAWWYRRPGAQPGPEAL